ncbi:MAG: site-2 protease family protein [Cyanobacteria bacterium J06614_10]
MPLVLLTLALGAVTYWVIRRSATKTALVPLWVLWLIMMMPVLVFTFWILVNAGSPPPPWLLYGLMLVSTLLLWITLRVSSARARQKQANVAEPADAKGTTKVTDKQTKPKKTVEKPITRDEETLLQRCFPWSIYYLQNIEYLPQAMICKGKLKASPGEAYDTVQQNVERNFGDRFLVLFQESFNGTPFFALVPNPQAKNAEQALLKSAAGSAPSAARSAQIARLRQLNQAKVTRPGLAIFLALATLLTTTYVGGTLIGGVSDISALHANPALLLSGLAYGLSLMFILGVHETGHYLATRYHRLRATLPYFIPVPFFLGTLGAFIQMRSPMPNRRALFDVGISGPLAGLVVSLPILLWGLAHSTIVPLGESSQLLSFESLNPGRSILLLLLSKLALGGALTADSALRLHPLAISGCLGLVVTALNLMPVGQLDGGHIVHAMYGQRTAVTVSHVARILMLILAYAYQEFLLWAFLLFFIPAAEPALNDVSELNGPRDFLGLLSLALLVMIILPAPAALRSLLL